MSDDLGREHLFPPVVQLKEAHPLGAHAQRYQGHRFISLAVAAIAGSSLPFDIAGCGQEPGCAVGPKTSPGREKRFGWIDPPANYVSAHAFDVRIAANVTNDVAGCIPGAKRILLFNELPGKASCFIVGIIFPFLQPYADRFATRLPLEKRSGGLDQVCSPAALVDKVQEFDRGLALHFRPPALGGVPDKTVHPHRPAFVIMDITFRAQ